VAVESDQLVMGYGASYESHFDAPIVQSEVGRRGLDYSSCSNQLVDA